MEAILYQYWRSSASWRVRWALAIKGLPFENIPLNITQGEQLTEAHRQRNPMGHVPALVLDGRCFAESVAIFEYLEETRPTPALYPKEPWLRARTRQVIELVNSGIQPLQNLAVTRKLSPDPEAQRAWIQHWNRRGLQALEALLVSIDQELGQPGTFSLGTQLSAADLFVVPQLTSARRFGLDLAAFPRLLRAEEHALATPHASAAQPDAQPDAVKP